MNFDVHELQKHRVRREMDACVHIVLSARNRIASLVGRIAPFRAQLAGAGSIVTAHNRRRGAGPGRSGRAMHAAIGPR